jgi:hypothetical protein
MAKDISESAFPAIMTSGRATSSLTISKYIGFSVGPFV